MAPATGKTTAMTTPDTPARSIRGQHEVIALGLVALGHDTRPARLAELTRRTGRPIPVFAELTHAEAASLIIMIGSELAALEARP